MTGHEHDSTGQEAVHIHRAAHHVVVGDTLRFPLDKLLQYWMQILVRH
jgi:hypothetical protein